MIKKKIQQKLYDYFMKIEKRVYRILYIKKKYTTLQKLIIIILVITNHHTIFIYYTTLL